MHILVTGGAGYIGSHVTLKLIEKGHKVTVVDNLISGNKRLIPKEAEFFKCDIKDKQKISNIIKKNKFNSIIHLAAFVEVEESVKYPNKYFENNRDNAINFFETCFQHDLRNIIFSSTAAVYGNQKNNAPVIETANLNPINAYAKSKLEVENFLLKNSDRFNYIILRYFNVAGADPLLRSGLISKNPTHLIKIISEVAIK